MTNPFKKLIARIVNSSIDQKLALKDRLRRQIEDNLRGLEAEPSIPTTGIITLIRGLLDVLKVQDELAAERFNLLKYGV